MPPVCVSYRLLWVLWVLFHVVRVGLIVRVGLAISAHQSVFDTLSRGGFWLLFHVVRVDLIVRVGLAISIHQSVFDTLSCGGFLVFVSRCPGRSSYLHPSVCV